MNLKLTILCSSLATACALAADSPTGSVAENTNSPAHLPRIVVVAQKEPAESQRLPVSVTPVTSSTLQEADVRQVKQAEIYAPNVFINEFSARKLSNPYFRGVGSSPLNPGVTTYIDGVPQLNANSSSIELVDVEQIEFVRGPQGALFGRNTVGGLINITSRRPSPLLETAADVEFGNYNFRDVRAAVSGPLSKGETALSVSGGYSARDGYTVNDFTGHDLDSREAFFGKGQFLWTPSEHWEVRFILSGESDRDGDYALGDLDRIRANPHHVLRNFEGSTERDIVAPTLIASYMGETIDATMTAGLVWWETRDLTSMDLYPVPPPTPMVIRENHERDVQFTDEFRVASAKDAPAVLSDALSLRWQMGLSVFTQDYTQDAVNRFGTGALYQQNQFFPGFPPFPSPPNALHSPESELNDVGVGAFAQATLVVQEKLDVGLGIHGDYEDKEAELNTFFAAPDPILGPLAQPVHNTASRSFCEGSPMASLAWHATPEKTAYVTVGRGYKTGGFNPIAPMGYDAYGEESSWNYEAGLKTSWCENRVAFNIAAFYINWQDLQLNLPNPNIVGQYYIANAGAADSKGVEAELHARPLAPWDLFVTGGYTDARFLSDSPVGLAGNHLIYSPDYTASAGTQYTWQVCRQAALYARAEIVAYGRFFYNPANTESQDAYTLANFRAGVRGSHWYLEGWVKNAFDTEYVPIALEFQNGGSGFVGESGAPVTFGLRAGLNF
jgi:iron complex outermembrane recepter protein